MGDFEGGERECGAVGAVEDVEGGAGDGSEEEDGNDEEDGPEAAAAKEAPAAAVATALGI